MRWTLVMAALLAAGAARAQPVTVESAVYAETVTDDGARVIVPADRLARGDRIVTILRWEAPHDGAYTAISRVPVGLAPESASNPGLEVSTDGGRSWQRIGRSGRIPREATHLRWQIRGGEGRLSYRAVVC
jgi:hypothetical protein